MFFYFYIIAQIIIFVNQVIFLKIQENNSNYIFKIYSKTSTLDTPVDKSF